MAAIEVMRLSKQFGRTVALNELSFQVEAGAVYALVGANGAGKTTLIKVLMNIAHATGGKAMVLGQNSDGLSGKSFCEIGYVSENQEMADWTTVGGMLDYFRAFYPTWDKELERKLVRQFDLPLKRKLKQLSRGMRMKAAFVSSLAYRPKLVMLDEPLSGLDPFVRDELVACLKEQAGEATVFLSSHDLSEIESFASHVGFLDSGRMLFSESMVSLMGRFREVTVVVEEGASIPSAAGWLNVARVGGEMRFVHSAFESEVSEAEVRAAIPTAGEIRFAPMPLRSIFLAISRNSRADRMREEDAREGTAA
jgi:ABC-2 type transport system ATP-binding protein